MADINIDITEELDLSLNICNDKELLIDVNSSKEIDLTLHDVINPLEMEMLINDDLKITIDEAGGSILPYYTGSYNVIPKVKSQKLETKNKSMSEDINIEQIPYEEVHNLKGTTVTIGGIF